MYRLLAVTLAATMTLVGCQPKEVAGSSKVQLFNVAKSKSLTIPSTGEFVDLATVSLDGNAAELLVTAFIQYDSFGCQNALNVTSRIVFDGKLISSYPPMTQTLLAKDSAPVGLGGMIDATEYDNYAADGKHKVTLQAAVELHEGNSTCVKASNRVMNIMGVTALPMETK